MLAHLRAQPGHRILEIGAGTGYNAALLATLVGSSGAVTTVDVDPDVAQQARDQLTLAGYHDISVITGDGALGHAATAPYDGIIVTAGSWDIQEAWWRQLADGGRLVMPLRWRGQTRMAAFEHRDGRMISDGMTLCGFIPMRGEAVSDGQLSVHLDPDELVTLAYDEDQDIDATSLRGILSSPRTEECSGVTISRGFTWSGVWLRLSTQPRACRLSADRAAIEQRHIVDGPNTASMALTDSRWCPGRWAASCRTAWPRPDAGGVC